MLHTIIAALPLDFQLFAELVSHTIYRRAFIIETAFTKQGAVLKAFGQPVERRERLTRASSVQVAVEIASREMQLASPTVFTTAVERALKC